MLDAAGVPYEAVAANVDEEAVKIAMRAEKVAPRDLADALAELKAITIAQAAPGALVLGSDSLVALDDGTMLEKPESREQATAHLRARSGRPHDLVGSEERRGGQGGVRKGRSRGAA